jgi:hypothetical protein
MLRSAASRRAWHAGDDALGAHSSPQHAMARCGHGASPSPGAGVVSGEPTAPVQVWLVVLGDPEEPWRKLVEPDQPRRVDASVPAGCVRARVPIAVCGETPIRRRTEFGTKVLWLRAEHWLRPGQGSRPARPGPPACSGLCAYRHGSAGSRGGSWGGAGLGGPSQKLNPNVASESHATTRNGVAEASSWYLCGDRRTNEMTA